LIRSFNGKTPKIAKSAFVSEAAYVIGDVELGENVSVWPGAVLRADFGKMIIGDNSTIEDNCVIHTGTPRTVLGNVLIGRNVHVGHGAVLNCESIGDYVLIGMNATILHNVKIGDFCIIAAGCLVMEKMIIPDRSFVVGIPAKIKSKVTEEQLYWVKEAPLTYVDLMKQYKEQGLGSD
jgi:carbonic anhydrase/acetyltransferase-like protein (isoleucine patch superfamily)